jgi:hypothetical protein
MHNHFGCILMLGIIAGCGGNRRPPPLTCKSTVAQCVDPSAGLPDNTPFTSPTVINGFAFSATGTAFHNLTAGLVGLQFAPTGLEIELPSPSCMVTVEAGGWAGNITATALDQGGNIIDSATTPTPNQSHTLTLKGSQITRVTLKDGGNEGLLFKICATP